MALPRWTRLLHHVRAQSNVRQNISSQTIAWNDKIVFVYVSMATIEVAEKLVGIYCVLESTIIQLWCLREFFHKTAAQNEICFISNSVKYFIMYWESRNIDIVFRLFFYLFVSVVISYITV
jgi:hypothetical protein